MFKTLKNTERAPMVGCLVILMVLLGAACTGQPVDKTDKTDKAIKEAMKDELVLALGTSREALDLFDEASEALARKVPDLATAQTRLEAALKASPDFLEAQFNLGVVYESNGFFDKALDAYQKAQTLDKLNTHSVNTTLAIGRTQSLKGDAESALKSFEEAHRLDPENLDVLNALGAASYKAGKYKQSIEYITQVLREENENLTALNTLAQVYTAQDNRSMAVYVFKKAARVAIGAVKNDEELNAEPAVLVLTDKVKLAEIDGDLAADLFNNLGMIYLKMELTPLAVYNYNAAAKLSPTHVDSRLNLGSIYIGYLNYEGAKTQFTKALETAPENCVAKLGLAASHFALGDRDTAMTGYQGYIEKCNADHASSHLQLQRIFERKEDYASAIKHCEKFVALAKPKEGDPVTAQYCQALSNMEKMKRDGPVEAPPGGEEGGEAPEEGGEVDEEAPEGDEAPVEEGGEAPEAPEGGEAPE